MCVVIFWLLQMTECYTEPMPLHFKLLWTCFSDWCCKKSFSYPFWAAWQKSRADTNETVLRKTIPLWGTVGIQTNSLGYFLNTAQRHSKCTQPPANARHPSQSSTVQNMPVQSQFPSVVTQLNNWACYSVLCLQRSWALAKARCSRVALLMQGWQRRCSNYA